MSTFRHPLGRAGGCGGRPASGQLILILTGELSTDRQNSTAFVSVALNNSVALDANSLRVTGPNPVRASITVLITGLTPGVPITFEARYKVIGGGSATFNARQIIVIPNLAVTTAR
jgi:hypothetical protein